MIITKEILKQKVPKDMMPSRLDSALNLYTNVQFEDKKGIILYNINPDTWNLLYPFYEINHKFTIDNYVFTCQNPTYEDLIKEYKAIYKKKYEEEKGYTKQMRINILKEEFIQTFALKDVNIGDELEPIFELKYSKSKNVWTLYYFENYVASSVTNLNALLNQKLYEQKILSLDNLGNEVDGIGLASNILYLLLDKSNMQKLKNNLLGVNK